MTNKNPYENGVDIPDFVEKNDKDVDMSVFKLSEEEIKESNIDDYDDEYEDEPRKKLSTKGILIIGAAIIVVLLVVAISGWIYGISKANAYAKLETEYTAVNTSLQDANKEIVTLKETNTALGEQIKKLQSSSSSSSSGESTVSGTKMKMTAGVNVRSAAKSDAKLVDVTKLPDSLKVQCNDNGTINEGADIVVIRTQTEGDKTWALISENPEAWVCIKNGSDSYAK